MTSTKKNKRQYKNIQTYLMNSINSKYCKGSLLIIIWITKLCLML
jgi:hypothetical protein